MKKGFFLLFTLLLSSQVLAQTSSLYVKHGRKLIDVAKFIKDEVDVSVEYGYENFCYQGSSDVVVVKIRKWYDSGFFFSGGGGDFVLRGVRIIRGFSTYDIVLKLEDEVVPGEFRNVVIKPCK